MSDTAKSVRDDIAFMRDMAEEGHSIAPLLGSLMILLGLVYGGACLVTYAINVDVIAASGWHPWPIRAALWIWVIGGLVVRQVLPKSRARLDRSLGAVWSGAGIAATIVVISLALIQQRLHAPDVFFALPSVFLAIYGAGWIGTAALARRRWMWAVALASFAAALISAGIMAKAPYLTLGACFLLLMGVPGAMILYQARKPA